VRIVRRAIDRLVGWDSTWPPPRPSTAVATVTDRAPQQWDGRHEIWSRMGHRFGVDVDMMASTALRLDVRYGPHGVERVDARFLAPCPIAELVAENGVVDVRWRTPLVIEHLMAQRQWAGDCP
jgi:hypothetical protein